MQKMGFLYALFCISSIISMEDDQVEIITQDHETLTISKNIAQKIPLFKLALQNTRKKKPIPCENIDSYTLQAIISIVEYVYKKSPVLEIDKRFFEKTKEHPAYSPLDIPQQINSDPIQSFIEETARPLSCIYAAANRLQLAWLAKEQDKTSIADILTVEHNVSPRFHQKKISHHRDTHIVALMMPNLLKLMPDIIHNFPTGTIQSLSFSFLGITNAVGIHLMDHTERHNIQSLCLNNNSLTTLSCDALAQLPQLIAVDLSHNLFKTLRSDTFAYAKALQGINLLDNPLEILPPRVFYNVPNLRLLLLSIKGQNTIPDGIFDHLSNLEILYLDIHEPINLPKTLLYQLQNLKVLHINAHKIPQLPNHFLDHTPNLNMLSLHAKKLQKIPESVLHNLSKLQHLKNISIPQNRFNKHTKRQIKHALRDVPTVELS